MKQHEQVVVDVGNSLCKVGLVQAESIVDVYTFSLEECAYQPWRHRQVHDLLATSLPWSLSGSNPPIIKSFADWLHAHGQILTVIDAHSPLPLQILVDVPEKVGRDRLMHALAVEQRPALIISTGSAVTVDAVDAQGAFLGGAIFPGLRLMAKSLHEYTAKLPMIDARSHAPQLPGKNTEQAMHAGIVQAVVGGIVGCITEMLSLFSSATRPTIYLTGGDAPSLEKYLPWPVEHRPWLTLQGILIATRAVQS